MQQLAILANPRHKRKSRKTRRSRKARRNPELMLLSGNPKRRKARRHGVRRKTVRRRVRHNPARKGHLRRTSRRKVATRRAHGRSRRNPGIEDAILANPRGKKVSARRRTQIRKMAKAGRSRKSIARFTKLSPGTIGRYAHFRGARKAGRRKPRRSVSITVPKGYRVRRGVRRGRQFGFSINPKAGLFGNISSNVVSAAFVAAGFIGSRFVANLLKGIMPFAFLKNDLVTNAVVPVVLTFMPEKFPQKRALMGGAYLSWVMKLLGQILPESWKNQISGVDAYVTAQPNWMQIPDMSMFGYPMGPGGTDEWGRSSGTYVTSRLGEYANAVPGASPPVLSHGMQLSEVTTRSPVPVIGNGMDEELEAEGMTGASGY